METMSITFVKYPLVLLLMICTRQHLLLVWTSFCA